MQHWAAIHSDACQWSTGALQKLSYQHDAQARDRRVEMRTHATALDITGSLALKRYTKPSHKL